MFYPERKINYIHETNTGIILYYKVFLVEQKSITFIIKVNRDHLYCNQTSKIPNKCVLSCVTYNAAIVNMTYYLLNKITAKVKVKKTNMSCQYITVIKIIKCDFKAMTQ